MKRNILNNKIYLYMTEFFAGMSVMAVELGASRLLAPYFSSSQIVWTIIIGTIMIAMALGNIMGGRWADKDPNPDKLYGRIIIAAIWIALIPVDVSNNTNRELFASESDKMIDNFKKGYQKETDEDLYQMMERVDIGLVKYEAGDRILTDDKAPVELLSMNAIDALIRDEVDYYKDIYNEKGLKGLLEEL